MTFFNFPYLEILVYIKKIHCYFFRKFMLSFSTMSEEKNRAVIILSQPLPLPLPDPLGFRRGVEPDPNGPYRPEPPKGPSKRKQKH